MKRILSSHGLYASFGIALIRIVTGILMIYHGWELWDAEKISGYSQWLTDLKFPAPSLMALAGKATELITGILFTLGLFTRFAAIALSIAMATVTFGMGHGKFLTDDQHPFLFVLLAILLFFTGAGRFSLDYLLFDQRKRAVSFHP